MPFFLAKWCICSIRIKDCIFESGCPQRKLGIKITAWNKKIVAVKPKQSKYLYKKGQKKTSCHYICSSVLSQFVDFEFPISISGVQFQFLVSVTNGVDSTVRRHRRPTLIENFRRLKWRPIRCTITSKEISDSPNKRSILWWSILLTYLL